jgi:PAT family beta-lactamase induction signal transducer AmpG
MNLSKPARYALFGSLYFIQGSVFSFFTALNAIYLLSFGVPMSQIGLMGTLIMIPFVLKIFLGMLSDKVNLLGAGHRKPYIVIGIILQALCLFFIPRVNPGTQFWLYALTGFILQAGMALYDTCTDGLALDTTAKEEEGTIQGFMVGGRAMGVVVLSAVLGLLVKAASWQVAFWLLGAISLLPLVLILQVKEAPRPVERQFDWGAFKSFRKGGVIALGLVGLLYSLIINGSNELVNPFLQKEYGINVAQAGFYTTVWGIGVVVGGLSGGRIVDRIGHRKALLVAAVVCLVGGLALAVIPSPAAAWGIVVLFGLAFGYYETVYFATSMDSTDRRIAASMYSILMAVANIGTGIGLGIAGALSDGIGFRLTFVILAALNMFILPLANAVFKKAPSPSLNNKTGIYLG